MNIINIIIMIHCCSTAEDDRQGNHQGSEIKLSHYAYSML